MKLFLLHFKNIYMELKPPVNASCLLDTTVILIANVIYFVKLYYPPFPQRNKSHVSITVIIYSQL